MIILSFSHLYGAVVLTPSITSGATSFHLSIRGNLGEIARLVTFVICYVVIRRTSGNFVTIFDPRGNFDGCLVDTFRIYIEVEKDSTNVTDRSNIICDIDQDTSGVSIAYDDIHWKIISGESIKNMKDTGWLATWDSLLVSRSKGRACGGGCDSWKQRRAGGGGCAGRSR